MRLIDIAKEAGVSPSTVSRIINNSGANVASKEVQDRVWKIVRESGYRPNAIARDLRTGSTETQTEVQKTIACVIARPFVSLSDPFFSAIARGIEEEAYAHNIFMKYSFTASDLYDLKQIESLGASKICGIAILGRCDINTFRDLWQKSGRIRSMVYAGLNNADVNCDQVLCDGSDAAATAVSYLIHHGHRRIAYIGDCENEIRFQGYRSTLEQNNIRYDPALVIDRPLAFENGYGGFQTLWQRVPDITAVFCANDQTAIGTIKAATELGLQIPRDISVIGIDDIDMSRYISPALTTVHIPTNEIGRVAAKVLMDHMDKGHSSRLKTFLPSYLIERESCTRPSR